MIIGNIGRLTSVNCVISVTHLAQSKVILGCHFQSSLPRIQVNLPDRARGKAENDAQRCLHVRHFV